MDKESLFRMIGASNHSKGERETHDFYATDPELAKMLCAVEKFTNPVWECACGQGHLSKALIECGYDVFSSDLIDRGYGQGGTDFFGVVYPWEGDIITNPPYSLAVEFVKHALFLISEGHKVAMFLKLSFLEGKERRRFFTKYPPILYGFRLLAPNALKTAILTHIKALPSLMRGLYG